MMKDTENAVFTHIMTTETMKNFLISQKEQGASDNMHRRFSCAIRALYEYLPDDKALTRERLLAWRKSLEDGGYASMTVLNYVKYINKYLDYVGASKIRFNRGKGKDIAGMTFGYLTAIRPTEKRDRKDIIWVCQCKCGNVIELAATRMISGNTLSCGCLHKEQFQRANKYIDKTSLRQSLEEKVESCRSISGYTGVTPKRNKWQAYITYKGKHYSLGCYSDIEDAVKARARGKELVQADAMGLLNFYEEIHKFDPALPSRDTEPQRAFPSSKWQVNAQPQDMARRMDNQSGHTGVSLVHNRWEARICRNGVRYILGSFEVFDDAVQARKKAERDFTHDTDGTAARYKKLFRHNYYGKKNTT